MSYDDPMIVMEGPELWGMYMQVPRMIAAASASDPASCARDAGGSLEGQGTRECSRRGKGGGEWVVGVVVRRHDTQVRIQRQLSTNAPFDRG